MRSIRKEIARLQRKSEKAQQDIETDARMRAEIADATVQRLRDVLRAADDDHPLLRQAITTWVDPIAPDIELMLRGLLTTTPGRESVARRMFNGAQQYQ